MRITIVEAVELAKSKVVEMSEISDCGSWSLLLDDVVHLEDGWLFPYNSDLFLKSGDPLDALAGATPVYVRHDGSVHTLPEYLSVEAAVARLEASMRR